MKKEKSKRGFLLQGCHGFSLIEVLLGISVFMIGMLGVTALNISSLKSNTFSGNLSEATLLAAAKIEEIMAQDFDLIVAGGTDGTDQDDDDDGIDDDAAAPGTHDDDDNFGLDDIGVNADGKDEGIGKNKIYSVYWNVAENEPLSSGLERSKTINVIVYWKIKEEARQISMSVVRTKDF